MCPQPVGHCLLTSHHSCKWARWPPWEQPWHQAYKPRTTLWHTLHTAHSELWQRSQSHPVRCRSLLHCPQLVCTVVDCWFNCITLGIHASWITWHQRIKLILSYKKQNRVAIILQVILTSLLPRSFNKHLIFKDISWNRIHESNCHSRK